MKDESNRPVISVVIEGYNDSLDLGTVEAAVHALRNQDFPLARVEVILVGSRAQAEHWQGVYGDDATFWAVKVVGCDGAHYYQLKNEGARVASGEVLGFLDSDVVPESNWLREIVDAIVGRGAEAVAGISLFRDEAGRYGPANPVLLAAASISWGFVVPRDANAPRAKPNAFLSHNLGIRRDVFCRHEYREDLGRTCAGSFLFSNLITSGADMRFQAQQRIAHNFALWWWLSRLHLRFGYEVFRLRRLDDRYPNKFLARTGWLEPLFSWGWHVLLDVPRWLRFSRALNMHQSRRYLYLPVVCGLSILARGSEAVGMYLTLMAPARMEERARHS